MALRFNEDGSFRLLLIADAQDTDEPQRETQEIIRRSLARVKPDLAVLLGDNIAGDFDGVSPERTAIAVKKAAEPFCEAGVPFALVFGNHDHEGLKNRCGFTEREAKRFILEEFLKYPGCLVEAGEPEDGLCTYNLPILGSRSERAAFNLWFIDSGTYADKGGYGYPSRAQNEWYARKSDELKAQNGGEPVPSFLFQHIPVPEAYRLMKRCPVYLPGCVAGGTRLYRGFYRGYKNRQGKFREAPCCAGVHHAQFESWKNQRDIICAFFGHDHANDWLGMVDGIDLCAVPAAGYYSYGCFHGARAVEIKENDARNYSSKVLTEFELLDGPVLPRYKQRHGYCEYKNRKPWQLF